MNHLRAGAVSDAPHAGDAVAAGAGRASTGLVPRLAGLTGLRFLAAISVVVHHFGKQNMPGWTLSYFRGGGYLVDVFFVLSGFLLGYAYTSPTGLSIPRRPFLLGRFTRLYPAYLIALALATFRFHELFPHGRPLVVALKIFFIGVLTLTMTQSWLPKAQSWNDPAWSLSDEAFFYLVMALVAPLCLRRNLARTALVLVLLCFLSAGLLSHIHTVNWLDRVPLLRIAPFLLAMLVGHWFRFATVRATGLLVGSALQVVSLGVLAYVVAHPPRAGWDHLLVSLLGILAILALCTERRGIVALFLDSYVMRLLGDASYGVYIYQVGVFWLVRHFYHQDLLTPLRFYATASVLTLGSIASVKWFEVPARHFLTKWLARGSSPRRPALIPEAGEASSEGYWNPAP